MTDIIGIRTHYSFREAYGKPSDIVSAISDMGYTRAAICDLNCIGHRKFRESCREHGITPVYGLRHKGEIYLAKGHVRALYAFASRSNMARDMGPGPGLKRNLAVIRNGDKSVEYSKDHLYFELSPSVSQLGVQTHLDQGHQPIIVQDIRYPRYGDRMLLETIAAKYLRLSYYRNYIRTPDELFDFLSHRFSAPIVDTASKNTANLLDSLGTIELESSNLELPEFTPDRLRAMCIHGMRNMRLNSAQYKARLQKELNVIEHKKFDWYFIVVAELVSHIEALTGVVGIGRGSACGSLVCYILGITKVDPLIYGTVFERFIDVTRNDLPDIDIDLTQYGRELATHYISRQFPFTSRMITISRYHIRSLQADIRTSFKSVPDLPSTVYKRLEDTARHRGVHPSAIAISSIPLHNIAPVINGAMQLDKFDSEKLAGIIKIDALGLNQLNTFEDYCNTTGLALERFHPDNCGEKYLDKFNSLESYGAGIFQFGDAVKSVAREITFERLSDIFDCIAIARPGPRDSGAVDKWLAARMSKTIPKTGVTSLDEILSETNGVFIYQEQIMKICRNVAGLPWQEVNGIRYAFSKKLPDKMAEYRDKFLTGCKDRNGEWEWEKLWRAIEGCSGYLFNRAHAVAYGITAYVCMGMKHESAGDFYAASMTYSTEPLAFAQEASKNHGINIIPFDADKSHYSKWTYQDGALVAPLTNVIGVGPKLAAKADSLRVSGQPLPSAFQWNSSNDNLKFRISSLTPIKDSILAKIGSLESVNIVSRPSPIGDIGELAVYDRDSRSVITYVFIGLVKFKSVKPSKNSLRHKTDKYLSFQLVDDTGKVFVRYHPRRDQDLDTARQLIHNGTMLAVKGKLYRTKTFTMVFANNWRVL